MCCDDEGAIYIDSALKGEKKMWTDVWSEDQNETPEIVAVRCVNVMYRGDLMVFMH